MFQIGNQSNSGAVTDTELQELIDQVNELNDRVINNVTVSADNPNNADGKPDGSLWYKVLP